MNREILFKAKRIDNEEWVEGYYFCAGGKYMILNFTEKKCELYHNMYEVQADTLCQYTGLNDKNGKKIWENDIVNCYESECFGVIKWEEDEARFIFDIVLEDLAFEPEDVYDYIDDMEVVGNIFDNSELLKEGAENE